MAQLSEETGKLAGMGQETPRTIARDRFIAAFERWHKWAMEESNVGDFRAYSAEEYATICADKLIELLDSL